MSQHVIKSNQLMVIFLLLILQVNEALKKIYGNTWIHGLYLEEVEFFWSTFELSSSRFTTLISFGCTSIAIRLQIIYTYQHWSVFDSLVCNFHLLYVEPF
jgi:hypothetical protein